MKLSLEESDARERLRNYSGENVERVDLILRALLYQALLNYADKEKIVIPYLGNIYIKYNGDKISNKGREADLDIFFSPSDFLKENIGIYEDSLKGDADLMDIPIMKLFQKDTRLEVKDQLTDTYEEVSETLKNQE